MQMASCVRPYRIAKSAIGVVLCASLLVAQQPPPAAPNPSTPDVVFTVTTALVQVDAVVTDSSGRQVTDLTAGDFSVYMDGKEQKITNFSYVRVTSSVAPGSKPEPKQSSKWSALLPPLPPPSLRPEDVRRTIVLMVDDLGLSFEDMAWVRSSLHKFVERQIQPGDLVAVCRTSAGSGAQQQFTADKRILLSLVDGLRWNPNGRAGVGFFDPYGTYSALAEKTAGKDLGARNGDADALNATYNVSRNTVLTVGTLGAVNYIVGALREMPGRKSIVLFSDGLQLFTPAQGPVMHHGPDNIQEMESNDQIQVALRRLVDRANRAGTVIYTMHAAGLEPIQPTAADHIDLTGMSGPQMLSALTAVTQVGQGRDVQFNVGQQGLAYLAHETGGIPYQNGNDLNWGLDRVMEDQAGYYLIGFKPPSDTFEEKHGARGYHHVSLKVLPPKLHVRSRSGFFGETDTETLPKYATTLERMQAAMLSPFKSSDVRLRLTALYAEVPKHGPVVRNLLYIDAQDLTFQESHGLDLSTRALSGPSAEVEIVAVATSMGGVPVAGVAHSYKVQAPAAGLDEALKQGVVYVLDVPVKKPGAYQIRVAVRDTGTGKVGSASQFLEIPELKKGRVSLTGVVLQNGERPVGAPAWSGMSPATRQFGPGAEVEYLSMVESGKKAIPASDLDSQIRIVRDGKDVYTGPAKLVAMDGGGLAVTGRLKLSHEMPPGDYYLGIIVADRTVRKNSAVAQWTDFEIIP